MTDRQFVPDSLLSAKGGKAKENRGKERTESFEADPKAVLVLLPHFRDKTNRNICKRFFCLVFYYTTVSFGPLI